MFRRHLARFLSFAARHRAFAALAAIALGCKAIRTSNPLAPPFRDVDPLRVTALGVLNASSDRLRLDYEKLMGRIK